MTITTVLPLRDARSLRFEYLPCKLRRHMHSLHTIPTMTTVIRIDVHCVSVIPVPAGAFSMVVVVFSGPMGMQFLKIDDLSHCIKL